MPANSHTRSRRPFSSEIFSFSVSKGPVDRRCGSMQEKINGKLNYLDQYFVGLATRAASCQKSCHFVGAINSAFRRLTHRRTSCRSCHHALPFLPVIHPSAHGLHSCAPTWPPPIWITAIQVNSRAPWCAERRHRQLAITELGALESQFGRRLLLITSRRQPGLWISIDRKERTWPLWYETTPHCIEVSPLLPAKTIEEWSMGILL